MKNLFKFSLFTYLFLVYSISLSAQELPDFISTDGWNHPENKALCGRMQSLKLRADAELAGNFYYRPYDVLKYDLDFDWYNLMNRPSTLDSNGFGVPAKEDFQWSGINTITLRVDTAQMTTIDFDAAALKINAVKVNNQTAVYNSSNNILTVTLNNSAKLNDTLVVEIHFEYNLFTGTDYRRFTGFFLMPKRMYMGVIPMAPYDSAFVEERLAYTMSEPEDARYWMPCNDTPKDKALMSAKVRVPAGYTVASNGLLQNVAKNSNDWTYYWKTDQVMPTYLMHIASSKFKEYSDWYHKVTNPNDSVEIKYYVWQKDYNDTATDGSKYNAKWTFEKNVEMMKAYSSKFLEYPFEKYGLDVLFPYVYGGMEHQTITSINRVWLRQHALMGLAHELAHQWLGDLVTCSNWFDIWMNEGGATWSEAIWVESQYGRDWYFWDMLGKRDYYLQRGGSNLPPIYGLPVNTIFSQYAVLVYQKASWIYHMLRTMLGDDQYFNALRGYMNQYRMKSANKDEMRQSFESQISNPPVPFNTFFDQWLMKQGHPVFNLNATTTLNNSGIYTTTIQLKQIQPVDLISDFFTVPVRVVFVGENNQVKIDTLLQTSREQMFTRQIGFYPTAVTIDTAHILCEVASITTSVLESRDNDGLGLSVYPNPVYSGQNAEVEMNIPNITDEKIELYDNLGNKVLLIYSGRLDKGKYKFSFNTDMLTQGIYYIKAGNESNSNFAKISIIK